jgi:hypothetical protein
MTITYYFSYRKPLVRHDQIDPPEETVTSFEGDDDGCPYEFDTEDDGLGDDATDIAEYIKDNPTPDYIEAIDDCIENDLIDPDKMLSKDPDFESYMKDKYFDKAREACCDD